MNRRRFLSLGAMAPVAMAAASQAAVNAESANPEPVADAAYTASTSQGFHAAVTIVDESLRQYILGWAPLRRIETR